MKKIYLFGLAVLGLMSVSCQRQEIAAPVEENAVSGNYTIVAQMEQNVETRTTVEIEGEGEEAVGRLLWSEGDKMTVMSVNTDSGEFLFHEFTLSSGAGDSQGTFTGTLGEGEMPYFMIYPSAVNFNPYSEDASFVLPKVYGDVDTDYAPNTNAIMMANPMVATEEGTCNFSHLGGVLALNIKGIPADAKGVVLTTNKGVTGNWSFMEDVMAGVISAKEATEDNNSITILFKPKDEVRSETFYFPLPTGTYQFKVEYLDAAEKKIVIIDSQKENTIKRADLLMMPELSIVEEETPTAKITFSDIQHLDATVNIELPEGPGDYYYYIGSIGYVPNLTSEQIESGIQDGIATIINPDHVDLMSDGKYAAANNSFLAWYQANMGSTYYKTNVGYAYFVGLVPADNRDEDHVVYEVLTLKGYALNAESTANVTIVYDSAAQTTTQVKATITPDEGTSFFYSSTPLTESEYVGYIGDDEALMKKLIGKGTSAPKTTKQSFSYKCGPGQTYYLAVYAIDANMEGKIQVQKLESPEVTYNEDIKMDLEVMHQGFRYVDVKIEATGGALKQIRWGYMKKSEFESNATLTANGTDLEKMMEIAEEQLAVNNTIKQRGLINNDNLAQDNLYSIENMYYEEDTYLCVIGYDNNDVPTRMVYTLLDLNETDPLANFDASLAAPTVKDVYYIINSTGYKQALTNWTNINTVADIVGLDSKTGMYYLDLDWGTAGKPKRMWLSSHNDLNDPAKALISGDAKHDALEVLKKRSGSAAGSGTAPDFYGRSASTGALSLTGVVLPGTTEYATIRNKKTDPISAKTLYLVWETNDGKYGFMSVVPEDYLGQLLYLVPNANWKQADARFAAYFWNGSGDTTWTDMTDADADGIYETLVPKGYPSVIFCRMNPNATENNWDNKWNQTGDLVVPTDGNNLYTVPEGAWDGSDGNNWSVK